MAESQINSPAANPEKSVYRPELPTTPEKYVETPAPMEQLPREAVPVSATPLSPPAIPAAVPPAADSEVLVKVEKILAENMDSVFLAMDAVLQLRFKQAGEVTARQIQTLMQKTKVRVQDLIQLIINWLRIIPGVNRYYLEQEAKIKADAILNLYKNKTS